MRRSASKAVIPNIPFIDLLAISRLINLELARETASTFPDLKRSPGATESSLRRGELHVADMQGP